MAKNFFGKLSERLSEALGVKSEIDEELFDDLEEILITSDIGMDTTMTLMQDIRDMADFRKIKKAEGVKELLMRAMSNKVNKGDRMKIRAERPLIILMIGINGGGKTTSIGKMANRFKNQGESVLLIAGDTFRAAAADQLKIWGERVGVGVISHQEGADPSAVLYDGIQAAKARGTDIIICDTAGRLQNKKNLMSELEKMNRIIDREFPEAARETLLVLDATTGKNAISQAKEFGEVADLSGVVITKLDGTAKGGIAITITDEFNLPIKFIGVGEGIDDLKEFNPDEFIEGIFE